MTDTVQFYLKKLKVNKRYKAEAIDKLKALGFEPAGDRFLRKEFLYKNSIPYDVYFSIKTGKFYCKVPKSHYQELGSSINKNLRALSYWLSQRIPGTKKYTIRGLNYDNIIRDFGLTP